MAGLVWVKECELVFDRIARNVFLAGAIYVAEPSQKWKHVQCPLTHSLTRPCV